MSTEPTISDEQRAEWDDVVQWAREDLGDWEHSTQKVNVWLLQCVGERLTFLEADHARLVEENRRLCAEWERWQGAAEAANVEAE